MADGKAIDRRNLNITKSLERTKDNTFTRNSQEVLDYLGAWNQQSPGAGAGLDNKEDKSRQQNKFGSMTGLGASINIDNKKDRMALKLEKSSNLLPAGDQVNTHSRENSQVRLLEPNKINPEVEDFMR